jgi:hypothetical protein
MLHSAELRLCAMNHSAEIWRRLHAVRCRMESTPRYASLRGVTSICEFLCEFAIILKNDYTR